MRHIICSRISSTGCVRDLILSRWPTGEHWYGVQALEKGLVDAVETSD
ncbi:peptidase S49 domain-containing protein [Klebsiella pneumoniae subsp. ozaenae]|uniref:Peptidase S49 domain-containing protein n=1 Tax=Klebsiella pneumoniae subsp. ozaenae TaxID=574 RepID=A0A377ZFC4_KLEPO|nr:peptidase S49 domain-containing protein [Klebsiella pneumoniae subsp. ozaenae]